MPLYHADIFLPRQLTLPRGIFLLQYGRHARQAAKDDRYGDLTPHLPAYVNCDKARLIEVEVIDGKVVKVVYRQSLNQQKDICLAIDPRTWFVKTVWANLKSDTHPTLNPRRYARW